MDDFLSEKIIGFDIRIDNEGTSDEWFQRVTTSQMLRSGVITPLSIDRNIWPSIFDRVSFVEYEESCEDRFIDFPEGFWTGTFSDLWRNLQDLLNYLEQRRSRFTSQIFIVGISSINSEASRNYPDNMFPDITITTNPPVPQSDWKFLGYDVIGCGFFSGLMGWSHGGELDRKDLEGKFGPLLNEYHLFKNPSDAIIYTETANNRIPEHSPFYPCGLYEITRLNNNP